MKRESWGVNFKKQTKKAKPVQTEAAEQIEALEDVQSDLSDWEADFISSLQDQLDNDRTLTDRQVQKLDEIYEQRVLGE